MRAVLRYRRIPFRWVLRGSEDDVGIPPVPVDLIPVLVLPDGKPLANDHVQLFLEGGDYRVWAQTDADGRFTAKALRDGVYRVEETISAIRPGQKATPRACGTIKAGDKDVELQFAE